MLKPIEGLKDVPRAWRKKLHQVLAQWMSCQQFYSEPELYCVHRGIQPSIKNAMELAKQHDSEQGEFGDTRKFPPAALSA